MRILLSAALLLFTISTIRAQKIKQVSVSVISESLSYPFTRFNPIHPGVEIGLTLGQNEREKSLSQFNAYLGSYHHRKIQNSIMLRGEYLYRFKVLKPFGVDVLGGLGYMHTFYPVTVYEQDTSNGEFSELTQTGRPHAIANLGLGFTYMNKSKFEPFIKYELMVEAPFASGIPVVPHSLFKIGVNYKILKNTEE